MPVVATVLGSLAAGVARNAVVDEAKQSITLSQAEKLVGRTLLAKSINAAQSDSLVSASQAARVVPVMLMDTTLSTVPFITDVVATLHSLFTGMYLMAINLDNTVQGVEVRSRLARYNPERSALVAGYDLVAASLEALPAATSQYIGLPGTNALPRDTYFGIKPSLEASASDLNKVVNDVSNLAVGKMIDVCIGDRNYPVQINLLPMPATPANIVDIFTVGTYDTSMRARWREFKAGNISFWRDLILAGDRIDAFAQSASKDQSGYLKEMQKRSGKSALAFALSGEPSPSTASSIIVLNSATSDQLYREHGIDINDYRKRQELFRKTYAMMICEVDPEWESAKFYYRGIERPTEVNAANMKRSSKGDGSDVMELMKVYMSGSAPGRL